jgi:hypothetical protein
VLALRLGHRGRRSQVFDMPAFAAYPLHLSFFRTHHNGLGHAKVAAANAALVSMVTNHSFFAVRNFDPICQSLNKIGKQISADAYNNYNLTRSTVGIAGF